MLSAPRPAAGSAAEVVARTEALIPALRARAAAADEQRQMPPESVAELKAAGTARLYQPRRFGGCEADMRSGVLALSAVGRGCGSTAWSLVQHLTHNFMLSQWPDQGQHDIWDADPACFISGIFIPGCGRAQSVEGGYRLSGRWPLVSGVNTADWCLFAALVDGGGVETHRYFALPRAGIEIVDTWHAVGLKGSASNDVVVADAFVPGHRTLSIAELKGGPTPGNAVNRGPLYRTPSYSIFGVYISAAVLGIAEAGLELYLEGARRRLALTSGQKVGGYPTQQVKVAEASAAIAAARQLLFGVCDEASAIAAGDGLPDDEQRARFRSHAAFAGRLAARAVEQLWDAGASSSIYASNPMSRIFRDMSVAGRHFTQNWDVNGSTHGRVLMGFDLGDPTL
ncbi:acyl-CoA dehydrogenase family protein [Reyranella sp.]|uniref:acyl-CoA dehydrogenase family protein n=1 Tax=Reyranella sp. TaxID=1929291 RepID=UPI003BAD6318